MGAADVVPGVSGGTIAFITGIYERLIKAIKSVNFANIKLFFSGKFKDFWRNIDGTFLCCLIAGIGVSFLTLAKLMTYLIDNQPIMIWSFFFGLILASTVFVGRGVQWCWKTVLTFIAFAVLSFFITAPENAPLNTSGDYWFIFLCGAVAICAMILPGISGSFILLLLGQYYFMMDAISSLKVLIIITFVAGAGVGIVAFSRLLSWLFDHFKMLTLAALTGFMFGSLNKIWPWKETLTTFINKEGVAKPLSEQNVLPTQFGGDPQIWQAVLLILVGFGLIFGIELIAHQLKKRNVTSSESEC